MPSRGLRDHTGSTTMDKASPTGLSERKKLQGTVVEQKCVSRAVKISCSM